MSLKDKNLFEKGSRCLSDWRRNNQSMNSHKNIFTFLKDESLDRWTSLGEYVNVFSQSEAKELCLYLMIWKSWKIKRAKNDSSIFTTGWICQHPMNGFLNVTPQKTSPREVLVYSCSPKTCNKFTLSELSTTRRVYSIRLFLLFQCSNEMHKVFQIKTGLNDINLEVWRDRA